MFQGTSFTATLVTVVLCGWCAHAHAADDLVIPGDHSKYLLDKIPLAVDSDIDWNKAENLKKLRSEIVSVLTDVDLFIQPPLQPDPVSERGVEVKAETNPDVQTGDVP